LLVAALTCLVFGVITVNGRLLRGCRSRSSQTIFAAGLQQSSSKRCEWDLTNSLSFKLLMNLFLYAASSPSDKRHMYMQCTELVPAVAAGVIQWARIHWPAEKICQSVELCDAATLTTTQARITSLFVVHQAMGLSTLVIAACCCPHSVLPFTCEPCCHIHSHGNQMHLGANLHGS